MNKRRNSGFIKSAEAGNWGCRGRRDGIIAESFVFLLFGRKSGELGLNGRMRYDRSVSEDEEPSRTEL